MGYPGGKSGPGVYHRLINLMPPHRTYIEAFLGGGAVMRLKRPAPYNIGVDLDAAVIGEWRSRIAGTADFAGVPAAAPQMPMPAAIGAPAAGPPEANPPLAATLGRPADPRRRRAVDPPILDPPRFRFLRGDALTFLASYPFAADDLIYCDPPYLMETRSSGPLYRHEFSDAQHAELLASIGELPCRVLISGYWSEMYADVLHRWNSIHFEAMTRGGMATEWVWFNFPEPVALHDYRYLGETFRARQDLKRQKDRLIARLQSMSVLKKRMLLSAIASLGADDDATR
jgi:hypothetical protein